MDPVIIAVMVVVMITVMVDVIAAVMTVVMIAVMIVVMIAVMIVVMGAVMIALIIAVYCHDMYLCVTSSKPKSLTASGFPEGSMDQFQKPGVKRTEPLVAGPTHPAKRKFPRDKCRS